VNLKDVEVSEKEAIVSESAATLLTASDVKLYSEVLSGLTILGELVKRSQW